MKAFIERTNEGAVAMYLDSEAARAVLASLTFAAQFHEAIAPLARATECELRDCPLAEEANLVCR